MAEQNNLADGATPTAMPKLSENFQPIATAEVTTETPSAAARALAIPELLEKVLLELPLHDILLDQRVDWTWRNIVKDSPKLQKALFFRPYLDEQLCLEIPKNCWTAPCDCVEASGARPARHLVGDRDFFANGRPLEGLEGGDARWIPEGSNEDGFTVGFNPFLLVKRYASSNIRSMTDFRHDLYDFIEDAGRHSSLRKMLVTQQAVKELVIDGYPRPSPQLHIISCKPGAAGVTIGDISEHAKFFMAGYKMDVWRDHNYHFGPPPTFSAAEMLQDLSDCFDVLSAENEKDQSQ